MKVFLKLFCVGLLGLGASAWANNEILRGTISPLEDGNGVSQVTVTVYSDGYAEKSSISPEGNYHSSKLYLGPSVIKILMRNLEEVQDLRLFRRKGVISCAAMPNALNEFEGYVNHSYKGVEVVKLEVSRTPCGSVDSIDHSSAKYLVYYLSQLMK